MPRPSLALHVAGKRQLVQEKLADVIHSLADAISPTPKQESQQQNEAVIPFCQYQLREAQALQQARKKAKGGERETITRNALAEYKPLIEEWLDKKIILESVIYTLVAMWAADAKDFVLLIRMTDNAIANRATELERTYIKRDIQTFAVSALMLHIKEDYLIEPESKYQAKLVKSELPDYFWQILQRVKSDLWLVHPNEKMDIFNIAGDAELSRGNKELCANYWRNSGDLSERGGRKVALQNLEKELEQV